MLCINKGGEIMDLDILTGLGAIGFVILIVLIVIFIGICPLIVAILVANYLMLTGISWWAVVIVLWLIIAGIISKLGSNNR